MNQHWWLYTCFWSSWNRAISCYFLTLIVDTDLRLSSIVINYVEIQEFQVWFKFEKNCMLWPSGINSKFKVILCVWVAFVLVVSRRWIVSNNNLHLKESFVCNLNWNWSRNGWETLKITFFVTFSRVLLLHSMLKLVFYIQYNIICEMRPFWVPRIKFGSD